MFIYLGILPFTYIKYMSKTSRILFCLHFDYFIEPLYLEGNIMLSNIELILNTDYTFNLIREADSRYFSDYNIVLI